MNWAAFRAVMKNEIWFFYRFWIIALGAALLFSIVSAVASKKELRVEETGRWQAAPGARSVLGIYFVLAATSLLMFAKVGSAANYALEPLASASLFGMEALGRLCQAGGGRRGFRRAWARLGVAAMGLALLGHIWWIRREAVAGAMFSSPNPSAEDIEAGRALLQAVRSAQGDVLTEFPAFSILAGKAITYEPFIMSRLAAEGKWDESRIINQVASRRFGLIVTSEDLRRVDEGGNFQRYTPGLARAIARHYEVKYVLRSPTLRGGVFLWLPRAKLQEGADVKSIAAGVRRMRVDG